MLKIETLKLENKRVFLRADLNVPLDGTTILSDFKLQKIMHTLDYLIQKKCKIILATHIDRPENCELEYSTRILISWFIQKNYSILFMGELKQAEKTSHEMTPGSVLLLENLRFFSGEQSQDNLCREQFAQALAALSDFYINDAFGDLHRTDSSIITLPHLFARDKKAYGFLVAQELAALSHIKDRPERPFVLVLGGGKVKDKLPLILSLIDQVETLLLGPAVIFTFMAAQHQKTGNSLVEEKLIWQAALILEQARKKNKRIIFPVDYYAEKEDNKVLTLIAAQNLTDNLKGITIGPRTLEIFTKEINKAKTVFLNGAMGYENRPETRESFNQLLKVIAKSNAYSVIGGGDSVSAIYQLDLKKEINFCSTGGGATLAYLTNKPLPGLLALET